MDVDSQPSMEETILVGDNLMGKLTSPVIPPEIASHLLEGVDTCDQSLRNLFLCLQVNDIEPFCQDEIVLYQQCVQRRFYSSLLHLYDEELRKRLGDSEYKLGLSMPIDEAKERASQLESEATVLHRGLTLANAIKGEQGFHLRWSLNGRYTDTRRRLEGFKRGIQKREKERVKSATPNKWFFW